MAIDGKTVRRSRQLRTQKKFSEITAIPKWIDALELKGSIVTRDAMGCQKAIAAAIVGKQADYVLAHKGARTRHTGRQNVCLILPNGCTTTMPGQRARRRKEKDMGV